MQWLYRQNQWHHLAPVDPVKLAQPENVPTQALYQPFTFGFLDSLSDFDLSYQGVNGSQQSQHGDSAYDAVNLLPGPQDHFADGSGQDDGPDTVRISLRQYSKFQDLFVVGHDTILLVPPLDEQCDSSDTDWNSYKRCDATAYLRTTLLLFGYRGSLRRTSLTVSPVTNQHRNLQYNRESHP